MSAQAHGGDSITPHEITETFFLSSDALVHLSRTRKSEARGHQILLESADSGLQISLLLEGTTIDFLFGDSTRSRSSICKSDDCIRKVKNYVRSLSEKKQLEVVQFYRVVYSSLVKFHKKVESLGIFCDCVMVFYSKATLRKEVLEAFSKLYRILYDIENPSKEKD